MRFDVVSPGLSLADTTALAQEAEELGFSGLWIPEAGRTPYLQCAAAGMATSTLTIGTAIALAFTRSPMVTAQTAWELAETMSGPAGGRFVLGLGTQVKGHNERRFSVPFEHPGPKLREYVLALRAIWATFQGEAPLDFHGEFYRFDLITPFFSPPPLPAEARHIPIYTAGVNAWMARMAGEVCDGFHVHPFHSERYLREVVVPAVEGGAKTAGRTLDDVTLVCPVFAIVGDTEDERRTLRENTRAQLAFYASTRTYRPVLEMHGWGDVCDRLREKQAQGDIAGMTAEITDEMLDVYAVEADWDGIADAILARYGGVADRAFAYQGAGAWRSSPEARERWAALAARLEAAP